ncbi:MAG: hypothetical protein ACOCRX_09945 [Candidatus Woesearchaeota archaeon]
MNKEKLVLPTSILLGCLILGGFYYASQVNKQRSIERQQQIEIEREKQERIDKELKEQEAKEEEQQALNDCISDAEYNYQYRWYKECKALGKLTNKCIDFSELSFMEYLEKYELTLEDYIKERNLMSDPEDGSGANFATAIIDYSLRETSEECSCRLPISTADRFNETLEKNKTECFKMYSQN